MPGILLTHIGTLEVDDGVTVKVFYGRNLVQVEVKTEGAAPIVFTTDVRSGQVDDAGRTTGKSSES